MHDKIFLDSNVLVYLFSRQEPRKRAIALSTIHGRKCTTGTNNINETINVLRMKLRKSLDELLLALEDIEQVVEIVSFDTNTIRSASRIMDRYKYSYFDSLVIATALECGCSRLCTEDMQHGQRIDELLEIENIFA